MFDRVQKKRACIEQVDHIADPFDGGGRRLADLIADLLLEVVGVRLAVLGLGIASVTILTTQALPLVHVGGQ